MTAFEGLSMITVAFTSKVGKVMRLRVTRHFVIADIPSFFSKQYVTKLRFNQNSLFASAVHSVMSEKMTFYRTVMPYGTTENAMSKITHRSTNVYRI